MSQVSLIVILSFISNFHRIITFHGHFRNNNSDKQLYALLMPKLLSELEALSLNISLRLYVTN